MKKNPAGQNGTPDIILVTAVSYTTAILSKRFSEFIDFYRQNRL